jgi:hypothetical protein
MIFNIKNWNHRFWFEVYDVINPDDTLYCIIGRKNKRKWTAFNQSVWGCGSYNTKIRKVKRTLTSKIKGKLKVHSCNMCDNLRWET